MISSQRVVLKDERNHVNHEDERITVIKKSDTHVTT